MQCVFRSWRWAARPEVVDQTIGRDDLARVQRQEHQESAEFGRPDQDRLSVVQDLQGPEDAELEHGNVLQRSPSPA